MMAMARTISALCAMLIRDVARATPLSAPIRRPCISSGVICEAWMRGWLREISSRAAPMVLRSASNCQVMEAKKISASIAVQTTVVRP